MLLVLDYTQLNSEAAEKVKNDVDSFAQIKGLDSLYILVNKVDMRRSEHDMSPEEVIEFVRRKFNIKQDTDRVFEVSATRAAYVSNFMAELEQIEARGDVPEISELKTLKPLAMQAYGDFWQRRIKTLSIDQIKEDSQIIWEESGFDSFLNKSVLALLRKILPSIVISALNLALSVLKDLQNRIKSRRNSLSSDVNKVQKEIDHLVNDIKKLEESNQKLRQDIGSKDLVEKYGECVGRYFQDYSAIVVNFIEQDIQTALDRYVFEIENFLKGVKNELEQSIKIRSQDVQVQAQLQKECDLLLKT